MFEFPPICVFWGGSGEPLAPFGWAPGVHLAQISIFIVFVPILHGSWVPLGARGGTLWSHFGELFRFYGVLGSPREAFAPW